MKINTIVGLVMGIVCVVSAVTSIFGVAKLVKLGYDGVLGVPHNCYVYRSDGTCSEDKSQTKREVADSAAMVTVALPIAFFTFRKLLALRGEQ